MMKEIKTELEQSIDKIIEKARKTSNTFILDTAKLIKSELSRNKYSENPISELEVLQQMAKTRTKTIAIYDKAGRYDLRDKDAKELDLIQEFIPKEPSEQEIEELIAELMEAITLTEWANGEGYDIDINGKLITLSDSELEAINYLTLTLRYKNNG